MKQETRKTPLKKKKPLGNSRSPKEKKTPVPEITQGEARKSAVKNLVHSLKGEKEAEEIFFPCRINRYLAACGFGSRRQVEEFVLQGRVTLNGRKIDNLNVKVNKEDIVLFDSKRAKLPGKMLYYAMNKPAGYTVTRRRFRNEKSIYDILPDELASLNYAGRLDKESRGLLIFSNDGQFISAVTHPSRRLTKKYHVKVDRLVDEQVLRGEFYKGIRNEGELLKAVSVRILSQEKKIIEVSLNEGKKRQLRRMFKAMNMRVVDLYRISIGFLEIEALDLKEGKMKTFSPDQLLFGETPEEESLPENFNPWRKD